MTFFLLLLSRSWPPAGAGEGKACTCPGASELRAGSGARRRKGGSIPRNSRGRSAGAGQVAAPSPPPSRAARRPLLVWIRAHPAGRGGKEAQRGLVSWLVFLFKAPLSPCNGRGGRRNAQLPRLCPNPLGAGERARLTPAVPRLSLPQLRLASLFFLIPPAFFGGWSRC